MIELNTAKMIGGSATLRYLAKIMVLRFTLVGRMRYRLSLRLSPAWELNEARVHISLTLVASVVCPLLFAEMSAEAQSCRRRISRSVKREVDLLAGQSSRTVETVQRRSEETQP